MQVRKILGSKTVVRLTQAGFTVGSTTITGGTDGTLAKIVPGGRGTLRRLKKTGIRA